MAAPAAALLAAALDRYLPAISSAPRALPTERDVEGCDLLDRTPQLCIGSAADNVHTKDAALLIDLGGDDVYRNRAGGAYYADDQGQFGMFVSVNVDLDGDDIYETPPAFVFPPSPGFDGVHQVVGQGAAVGVGIGMLVDARGDDLYRVDAPPSDPAHRTVTAVAQGAAHAVFPSFAGLFDLAGDDVYRVTGGTGKDQVGLFAQGVAYALAPAEGALVDVGLGTDTYTIDAGEAVDAAVGDQTWPLHAAVGQGLASLDATGLLFDDGGRERFTLHAAARWVGPDGYPFNSPDLPLVKIPISNVAGQGMGGIGATGMLLTGLSNTEYVGEAEGIGIAHNSISVQGVAAAGVGVIDDLGGDDVYRARGSLGYEHQVRVDDSCVTAEGDPCESAKAFVHAYNTENFAQLVYAQGFGFLGGLGLLDDHVGNDTYALVAEARLETTLLDEMSTPRAPPELDVWGYGVQWTIGQGVGQGYGVGVLTDRYGGDAYSARASSRTFATSSSARSDGVPKVTALHPYRSGMFTQGVGYGIAGFGGLYDLGGSNDRFEVVSDVSVTTFPDTGGALPMSLGWPLAHGTAAAGNATSTFLALGQDPRINVAPARGVCPGSPSARGFGVWSDCDRFGEDPSHQPIDYKAVTPTAGAAPLAVGVQPTLSFTSDTPTSGQLGHRRNGGEGSSVEVGVLLRDATGLPLAGRTVHLDLNALLKIEDVFYKAWMTLWEVDAVTGPDGIARARIPLEDPSAWRVAPEGYDFRLLATFDGAVGRPGLLPAHAAVPFQLEP